MSQKFIDKIAIIISWPREIDLYSNFLKADNNNQIFDIIVNDIPSIERGRNKSNKLIQSLLENKETKFRLLSDVYKKIKYKAVISTGEISAYKINPYSIARFIYANTVGIFLYITKISNLLNFFFGRPFTAGAPNSIKIGLDWFPEKKIGNISIKFPDGADLKLINDFDWLEQQFNNQTVDKDTLTASPKVSNNDIKDLLDRFELLYGGDIENVRRFYNDKDLSSIFKLTENEELRKAVVEKNLHSIFRLSNTDDDLRKAVLEQNLHSVFRLVGGEEDLRKAVLDNNLYSLARIMPEVSDEFKIVNNNDFYALWKVLEKYTNSSYIKPLKALYNDTTFDTDSFSRGQLESKKWLVDTVKDLNLILGNIFLCAGWYATVIPMLQDNEISFNNVRSFDLDPNVWKTAEIFNKALTSDGWKFKAQTLDIQLLKYDGFEFETIKSNGNIEVIKDSANTIINTSCEHIENFTDWYAKIPNGKLVILQNNNFFEVNEHVNCVNDLDDFASQAPLSEILYDGELELPKYKRFMRIGYK